MCSALNLTLACVFWLPSSHDSQASPLCWEFGSHHAAFCLPTRKTKGPMGLPRNAEADHLQGPQRHPVDMIGRPVKYCSV